MENKSTENKIVKRRAKRKNVSNQTPKKKVAPKKSEPKQDIEKPQEPLKPKVVGGYKKMNGIATGPGFTKDNQPDPAKKLAGQQRARTLREFLSMPLKKGKLPKKYQDFVEEAQRAYGIPKEHIDVRLFMEMKLASNAIHNGDVHAYKALMDRVFGKPRQEQAPIVDLPENKEGTIIRLPGGAEIEI